MRAVVTWDDVRVPEYVPVTSNFSIPPLGFDGVTTKPAAFAVLVSRFRRVWRVLGVPLVWIVGPEAMVMASAELVVDGVVLLGHSLTSQCS